MYCAVCPSAPGGISIVLSAIPELRFNIRYKVPGISSGKNGIVKNLRAGEERDFFDTVPFEAADEGKITIEVDENFHK